MILAEGMVGLSGGTSFMQKAIRYFTGKSKFSHSFVICDSCNCYSALETTETRVTVTPVNRKLNEKNWVELWDVNESHENKRQALQVCYYMHSGEWYGYLSYFWFIWRWICRLFGKELTSMWKWCSKGMTCTELTCSYLTILFPELFLNDGNTYSPAELRKILTANPDKFTCLGWYKE